jgi:hypothetical protein
MKAHLLNTGFRVASTLDLNSVNILKFYRSPLLTLLNPLPFFHLLTFTLRDLTLCMFSGMSILRMYLSYLLQGMQLTSGLVVTTEPFLTTCSSAGDCGLLCLLGLHPLLPYPSLGVYSW